ncbi:MAG: hypothetical protein ACT4NY_02050 [Pseudonocardiales bacterium]
MPQQTSGGAPPDPQTVVPGASPGIAVGVAAGAAPVAGDGADDGASPRPGAVRTATAVEKPARPDRFRPPADVSALPDRLPEGGATAAAATVESRRGELQSMRRQQPAAALLREHRAAVATATGEADQSRRQAQGQDPAEGQDHGLRQGQTSGRGVGEDVGGAGLGGGGTQIGFVELDPEPLLPPLWGQSPEQHDKEVQAFKQGLAQDRAIGKARLADFTSQRQAKSAELTGLAATLTQQVNGAKQSALTRIGSAETAGVSAVQAAVRSAQASVQAQAQAARARVEAAHSAAVAAMNAAQATARAGMDKDSGTANQAVSEKQKGEVTALGKLYDGTEKRMRDAANRSGNSAVTAADGRVRGFLAGMIHRDDSWLDGPLTDNRCKAQADAAKAVGNAYKEELPKAADEPITDMRAGRPEAERQIGTIAADVRKSLTTVLTESKASLTSAHQRSRSSADDAKRTALQSISQALSVAQAGLTQQQNEQTAAIRTQAGQQRQAAERSAAGAVAAIGKGVSTARGGLDRGLTQFLRVLGQDEVPDPDQLDDVLRQTGGQLDKQLENSAEALRGQAGQAAKSLATMAEQGAQGMSDTAETASAAATQTASATGQALSNNATQAANGLQQVQQGYATLARNSQASHLSAGQKVVTGLGDAYTTLAGQFQQGADGQVKAVEDGLNTAATVDIHPKITEEAKKAYDKVKPRWHSVLTIVVVIIVAVALAIVLGPLIIGAVGAVAGALGASAAVAATIGTIVGGAIVGAVAGAAGQIVSNAMNGEPLMDGVVKAAIFGAVGGAVGGGAAAAVAKSALGAGARVAVEMAIEVVTEVGLGAGEAVVTGQAYGWGDVLLGAVTTVAVTGVMANPRVQGLTVRVQEGVTAGLKSFGIKVPAGSEGVDVPDAPATPKVDVPSPGKVDVPTPGKADGPTPAAPSGPKPDTPSAPKPDAAGPTPSGGTPQPGRGPDGATSWDVSDVDPTGGKGSADGPVRPRDQDGIEAELRTALGPLASQVDVRIDPSLSGRTVRVRHDVEEGQVTNVRMHAGPSATPADIRTHLPTARTLLRNGPEAPTGARNGPEVETPTRVGKSDHDLKVHRGPDGDEVWVCSSTCGPLKGKIDDILPQVRDPAVRAGLERLKADANALEDGMRNGNLPEAADRLTALRDLGDRLRVIGDANPRVGAMLDLGPDFSRLGISVGEPQTIRVADAASLDLPPGQQVLYVVRDRATGQILKVGETTAGAPLEARFGRYELAGRRLGVDVEVEVRPVDVPEGQSVWTYEQSLREQVDWGERGRLPWDNEKIIGIGPRLGREGPGTPFEPLPGGSRLRREGWTWNERGELVPPGNAPPPSFRRANAPPEVDAVRTRIAQAGGDVEVAAQAARVSPRTFYRWLQRYGIDPSEFRADRARIEPTRIVDTEPETRVRESAVTSASSRLGIIDPEGRRAIADAYDVISDFHAPFMVNVASKMLTDLKAEVRSNPNQKIVFVGRDGASLAAAVSKLDPAFFDEHCTQVTLSRALAEAAVQDRESIGSSFPDIHDFRGARGKVDPSNIVGAHSRLTRYLVSCGVPVNKPGSAVTLVDTSYKGTVQELLAAVYPNTNFRGHYAFFGASPSDPHPGTKKGHAMHLETGESHGGRPVPYLPDDPRLTFANQKALATIEETLHGPLSSPTAIEPAGPRQQPQSMEPDPLKGLNPLRVSPRYRDPSVREGVKEVGLASVHDFAAHIAEMRARGQDWEAALQAGDERFQAAVRAWVSGAEDIDPRFRELMDSFVRGDDKAHITELSSAIKQAELNEEQATAVWQAYGERQTDDQRRAFVEQFKQRHS